ncbi:hypothetical protein MITS9509_01360 [Synechococcus sp. MIT S9509]|uniref:hypothetical protein n=1 Tax=Synechococcus sp. MIT S9509 TaxID=1801630 RepID=UPI0007BBE3AA|nr:hypothetical protein [Synechococcus sp. MIT S9509]KZR92373.1 hypothetical protein MITS9509_01360 [Synechococcus sp. MIT S9509]
MATVTYAGSREELLGQKFDVPDAVLQQAKGQSVAQFIERQVDDKAAIEAAEAEATTRRQQSLAKRMEQERLEVEATVEATAQAEGQATRDAEFRVELSDLSLSVQQAGAAIVGKADVIEAAYSKWADDHQAVVDASAAAVEQAKQQVVFAQAVSQEGDDALKAHIQSQEQRISSLEEELRATVLQLQGPQGERGERGIAGSGVGYVDGDPNNIEQGSLGQRFYGRRVVPGDILLQRTADSLLVWRSADARSWTQVDEILNKQELVSSSWRAHADITNSMTTNTTIKSGGGGSTPLTTQVVNAAAGGAAQRIADGAAYGTELERINQFCNAAQVIVRATALDGPDAGKSNYAVFDLLREGTSAASETVSAELGTLGASVSLTLTPAGSGTVPAWAPGSPTTSSTHTPVISLTVDANTSGATQFAVEGAVTWAMPTDNGQPLKAAW